MATRTFFPRQLTTRVATTMYVNGCSAKLIAICFGWSIEATRDRIKHVQAYFRHRGIDVGTKVQFARAMLREGLIIEVMDERGGYYQVADQRRALPVTRAWNAPRWNHRHGEGWE